MWAMLAVFLVLGIGKAVQVTSAVPTGKDVVYQIVYGTTSAILVLLVVAVLILLPGGIYYVSARTEGATFRGSIFNWPLVILAGVVASEPYLRVRYRAIHRSAWKGNSAKFERPLGPHFIRILASLCATTICRVASYASRRRECAVAPAKDRCCARSCKRTSEKTPSTL